MIDRIIIENFKSLRRVDLTLGPMNLLVGANGSGKSNLLDALRVLQGIGNGFTISEILDGKPKSAISAVWDGIRGGSRHARFAKGGGGNNGIGDVTFEVHGRFAGGPFRTWIGPGEYDPSGEPALRWELLIAFSPTAACVTRERFKVDNVIYDTDHAEGFSQKDPKHKVRCRLEGSLGWSVELQPTRPALGQVARGPWGRDIGVAGSEGDLATLKRSELMREERVDQARGVAKLLANIQRLEPELPLLRNYSQVAEVQRMGDRGENFAALVQSICQDDRAKDAYLSWLRQLRPEEIDDVGLLQGAVGEPLFMLRENGREFPAMVPATAPCAWQLSPPHSSSRTCPLS